MFADPCRNTVRDAEHRREENFQSGPPCAPARQKQDSRCFSLLALLNGFRVVSPEGERFRS